MKKMLRIAAVTAATSIPQSSVYGGMAEGWFPKPAKMSPKIVAWDSEEIIRYQLNKLAERDGVPEAEREEWVEARFVDACVLAEIVAERRAALELKDKKAAKKAASKVREVA